MKMKLNFLVVGFFLAAVSVGVSQPVITTQPRNLYPSPSLGGKQAVRVSATGTPLPTFQWYLDGTALIGQTNTQVTFAQVQATNLGIYTVVVADAAGSVTSSPVRLDVDPTFTKITTGAIVTDIADGWDCAWGDYDNDGFLDLVVGTVGLNLLYHNNGDGTFAKITNSPIVTDVGFSAPIWGDYDNDGLLDLFIAEYGYKNRLYHNNGDGIFTKVTNGPLAQYVVNAVTAAWGDYDNDGLLDLAIANSNHPNELYRNNGDGTFVKMTTNQVGIMAASLGYFVDSCTWGDYDDDGYLDMLLTGVEGGRNVLIHNNGDGTFTQVTNTPIGKLVAGPGSPSGIWADFFNTGRLDLFVVNGGDAAAEDDWFYRNDGAGVFTSLSAAQVGPVVASNFQGFGCAAADYDNDGYLDLFVANYGGQGSFLWHNNGDGTLSRVTTGSLVHDSATSTGCAWGDYDNDGFMDLYVANGGFTGAQAGFLYRNNGNTNHWLKLKLVGTISNRAAIGAKVRLQATIRGQTFWQRRDVSGGSGGGNQDDLRPNFGLGDATVADLVRIEWPSGIVQELQNVAANQILTVTEPAKLSMPRVGELHIQCWKNMVFDVLTSTNLVDWTRQATVTNLNLTGGIQWTDPNAPGQSTLFYRAAAVEPRHKG